MCVNLEVVEYSDTTILIFVESIVDINKTIVVDFGMIIVVSNFDFDIMVNC